MAFTQLQTKLNKALVQNDDGDYALRTVMDGEQNLNGEHLLNDQTTTNMMSKGTVYRFDNDDDVITITDSAEIQNIFDGGGFISTKLYILSDGEGDSGRIVWKTDEGGKGWMIIAISQSGTNVQLRFQQEFSTTDGRWDTDVNIPINTWVDCVIAYNADAVANNPAIYINGVSVTVTEAQAPVGVRGTDVGEDMLFGCNSGGTRAYDGSIAEVMLGNFAPTAAEVKDLISGNIPFKWQYGSQTLVAPPSDDCADDDTANWADSNCALTFDTDHYVMTVATGATLASTRDNGTYVVGKEYTLSYLVKNGTGTGATCDLVAATSAGGTIAVSDGVVTTAAYQKVSLTYIATETNNRVYLRVAAASVADGETVLIDDIEAIPLGAVALYTQDSISATSWGDFANSNPGAVTGCEVLNDADSIADTFEWHVGAYAFGGSPLSRRVVIGGAGAYPETPNDTFFAPLDIPTLLHGKQIVIDQITAYYDTDANGDDFDFALTRSDLDGSTTEDVAVVDIGNGTTGAQNTTLLSSTVTLANFPYYVTINPNNTDANTDVKIYDIKFSGHLA